MTFINNTVVYAFGLYPEITVAIMSLVLIGILLGMVGKANSERRKKNGRQPITGDIS
jgi:hypothetical protein